MLVFGALASECASLPAPANTPLHHETWQERTAANAARRTVLLAPASQVNMTSKLQLASNIADAEVAAADQAWLNSRAAAKTLADATAAARAQAEIGARASAKAAHDANKAAEAEAEVEARSASKTMDDTKSAALAVHQTNLRADSKIKSDAMSLAASEAVKETRAGTKAATDAKAQVAAVDLTNAKAVAMVMADAKSEAVAEEAKQSRAESKTASDARAAAQNIMMKDAMASARNTAVAEAEAAAKASMASARASTAAAFWQKGRPSAAEAEAAANRAAVQHGDLPRYTTTHLPGGGVTYTKVAGAEPAADDQPSLSCKSLSPSATDYWCVTACAGRNNCPKNICKCDEGVTKLTPVTSIVPGVPSGTVPVSPLTMPLPPTAIMNMSMINDTIEAEAEVKVIYPVRNSMPAPSSVQQQQQQAAEQQQQQGNEAPAMTATNHGQMTPQQLLRVAAEQHAASVAAKENSPKKEQALAALAKATAALVQTQKWGHADPRATRSTIHDEAEKQQALAALRAASAALVAPGVQPPAADAAEQRSPSAEFSCVSLVPTATDAWCLATCGSSKGLSCPLAMCKCDGGEVLAETKLIDPTKMDGEMPVTEQPTVTSGVSELPLVTKGAPAKITCVSLVPNANDEWCQTVCGSGGRCPGNVCRCSHDGVPFDAGDQQQQAVPTHGKAPLERSASAPPVTHNGKPLPPADGPPLTRSPKLAHVGKGPHPGGNHPKHQGQYQATALLSEEAQLRQQAIMNLRAHAEATEALKMRNQYQSADRKSVV